MRGTNRNTGRLLTGDAHLAQSIADIITTPIGSRVMRRDYGSRVFDRIDAPFNQATKVLLYADVATALMRWEPRVAVERVALTPRDGDGGRWTLSVFGRKTGNGAPLNISVPIPIASGVV